MIQGVTQGDDPGGHPVGMIQGVTQGNDPGGSPRGMKQEIFLGDDPGLGDNLEDDPGGDRG